MSNVSLPNDEALSTSGGASEAVLTEAIRNLDIVHISLAGMTAIVVVLLAAVALPVFGLAPVTQPFAFVVMILAAFVGIGGLYYLNYRVHKHVTNQAYLTEVLVNSLGQGFLVFDREGVCGNVYSQACMDLLETEPANKKVAEVLRVPSGSREDFQEWVGVLFQRDHALGFDDVVRFLPAFFPHSQQRRVSLQYRPIRQRDGALLEVVVIATDQTEEYAARQIARQQQNFAEMICRIFKERNQFHATLAHLREFLEEANTLPADQSGATSLLRQLHTLKASVKQFCLLELGEVIHKVESEWRDPALADDNEAFHRRFLEGRQQIAAALLKTTDELGSLMGTEHEWRGNIREIEEGDLYAFVYEMEKAQAEPALIRRFLSTIAAVPVHDCFRPFERELKELASMMEKQIKPIRFVGSNPRVLTQPIQEFLFALTHISRNIMDHGIETPVTRMARGKDPAGQVTVDVEIVSDEATGGSWLHLAISDDGNGIDPSRIRAKLASIDPDGNWRFDDDQTVIQQIFTWGVSTNETVTTLSGRGVGLEAVKREVDLLGGRIRVDSELYKGLKFDIRIPYSLDICLVNRPETLKIPLEA